MRQYVSLCSTVFVMVLMGAVQAQLVVEKDAQKRNPTLHLASFTGEASVRQQLLSDLRLSDWFDVVETADANYHLQAIHNAAEPSLELRLATPAGNTQVRFRQPGAGNRPAWLVHSAVDTLIEQTFKRPGFCRSMMAYVVRQGNVKEIYLADFDGSSPRQLTHNRGLSVEPAWRADNKYILYTLYGATSTSVVLVDLARSQHRRLSWARGLNSGAAFSPNGEFVALTLSRDNNVELYKLRVSDQTLTRLTNTPGVEASPTWAPDGSSLCFVSDSATMRPTIYRMAASGGAMQRLLPGSTETVSPDWSGVSNQICFSTRQGGQYVLAVLDLSGGTGTPLVVTTGGGDWEAPSWAPDGRHVICTQTTGRGQRRLMIVDTWYGKAQPLSSPGGEPSLPTYSNPF